MAAFLFLVGKRAGNLALQEQVRTTSQVVPQYNIYLRFDQLQRELRERVPNDIDLSCTNEYFEWWDDFFRSFGWFRGRSMSVPVVYRGDRCTEADVRWLLRNCQFRIEDDNGVHRYVIERFRDRPQSLRLHYRSPSGTVTLEGYDAVNDTSFRARWRQELDRFLVDTFEFDDELRPLVGRIRDLLPAVISALTLELLRPKEVDPVVDDPFL